MELPRLRSTMQSGRARGVPREALMRVLPYFSCTRVQRLREVTQLWDEVCREHLKRVFENLLEEVRAKKMISEAKSLPACHWYPYSMGCVHYCLLVLHSTIESRFGRYSDSATIPGIILDRVKDIFKYIADIPLYYELPSDEIYDKLRNLYQISFSAVASLEKTSEKFCKDDVTKGYRTSVVTKHTDILESQEALKGFPRCCILGKNLAVALGVRSVRSYSKLETQPSINIQKTTDNGPNTSSIKDEQEPCTIQVSMKNVAKIEGCDDAKKTTKTVQIRKLKRPPITNNSEVSSTQVNKIDSQAGVSELVSESNNDNYKQKIADFLKEIKDLSTRLKDSEARNKEYSWKSCTLLSELSSYKNEINQLRSKSVLSSAAQNKSQVETENESSSLVANLRKQIRDYRRKLEESEGQLTETKRKNIASERKLARCERELAYWRLFHRRDAHNTRSITQRTPRTCVLQKTIRDYGEKLEKCQSKTLLLSRQHEKLMKKFKRLAAKSRESGTSNSMVLDFSTASVRSVETSTVVVNTKKRKRKGVSEVNELYQKPMTRSRSSGNDVLCQKRGKRQREIKHLRDSDQCRNSEKRKDVSNRSESSRALKKSRIIKEEKLNETFHSISVNSSHVSSILFQNDDRDVSDCIQLFSEDSLENMECKYPKTRNTRRSSRKRPGALIEEGLKQVNESSVSCHSDMRENVFPDLYLNTERKNESCTGSNPRLLSRIKAAQSDLQECVSSSKIENKADYTEIFESSRRNDNSNRNVTVNLQPACFGEHAIQRGNLKEFKDTRLPIYTCPVEQDTKCREVLQTTFKFDKSKETGNGNSKIIFGKHPLQIGTSRKLQVSTYNSQLKKTRNHVEMMQSPERAVTMLMEDNTREGQQVMEDKDTNTLRSLHPLPETRKEMGVSGTNFSQELSSAIASSRENTKPSVITPREYIKSIQTEEPEGNLNMNSLQKSHYSDTVSVSRCVQEQSEELRKLRLNTEIEITGCVEKTYDRQEEKLEKTLSPVASTPSEVPTPSVGAPGATGARVWSTRVRRSDCRLPPARTIRLKRRAAETSDAASMTGPTKGPCGLPLDCP